MSEVGTVWMRNDGDERQDKLAGPFGATSSNCIECCIESAANYRVSS